MKKTLHCVTLASLAFSCSLPLFAGDWPGWRGPEGNGISQDKDLPIKWGGKDNVRWRVALPGPGNSSPIVWGDRVFVSQAVDADHRRTLMCFDRATGKLLWQSGVTYNEDEATQENNPYCAGTPATDGKHVYVCFGSAGVFAFDFAGKEIWRRDLGKLNHMFGTAVSTVVHNDLCYVNFGPGENVKLVALKKATGEIAWEAEPPKVDPSEQGGPGGPGGPGGRGGRGGFGPGNALAPVIMQQADKAGAGHISLDDFVSLSGEWFDDIDQNKAGKLSRDEFDSGFNGLIPQPPPGAGGPPGGGRGGPGGLAGAGGALFALADADKDGALTRDEWRAATSKWAKDWDSDKSGTLNEEKFRNGLNALLPRPNFGGPGGPGGPGRPGGRGGMRGGGGGPSGSWSTPILVKAPGHDELVVGFPNRVVAYDPATGKQLWVSKGIGGSIYSSPVFGQNLVVSMSSGMGGGSAVALHPGGAGDVSEEQRVWKLDRVKGPMGSGIIHEGYFYTVSTDGIADCLDLKDGKVVWEERLTGSTARGSSWSSLLLADGRIYVPNQAGDVFVLRAAPKFEVLATNSVGEPTNASLAASNHEFFMRTDKALWCLGGAAK